MQGSIRRSPVRKPPTFPHLRDEFVVDGKKYREHVYGKMTKDTKTGLPVVLRIRDVHRVHNGPRIPRDKLTRKRGQHRRIGINP